MQMSEEHIHSGDESMQDWGLPFYSQMTEWWGSLYISDEDRQRADQIERHCGSGAKVVLELGAGCGGTAAATAAIGHHVVAVEICPARAGILREHAAQAARGFLHPIEGDFYQVNFDQRFDVVCYWNGFGIGSDADQRRLLRRISAEWLVDGGSVLMNVFNPAWWIRRSGDTERKTRRLTQGFDFDPVGSRFVDSWWPHGKPELAVAESIRCYAPVDLALLLEGTGLQLKRIEYDDGAAGSVQDDPIGAKEPLVGSWKYFVSLNHVVQPNTVAG